MSAIAKIAIESAVRALLTEFVVWQRQKLRDPSYKPSPADVDAFLARVDADTPDKIEAEARAEMG